MQNARLTKARRLVTSFAVLAIAVVGTIALVGTMVPRSSVGQTSTLVPPDNSLQLPQECNGAKPCWLNRRGVGNQTATQEYYKNIGPGRETLDKFKATNGFAPGVSGDVQAIYFNEGDLRFGRDMHCRQNGPK